MRLQNIHGTIWNMNSLTLSHCGTWLSPVYTAIRIAFPTDFIVEVPFLEDQRGKRSKLALEYPMSQELKSKKTYSIQVVQAQSGYGDLYSLQANDK